MHVAKTISPQQYANTYYNTDFPLQKPWQLLSAEVNFKGCFGTISMGLHGVGATAWMI